MKRVEIINGKGKRYLSELPEFSDGIPFTIVLFKYFTYLYLNQLFQ